MDDLVTTPETGFHYQDSDHSYWLDGSEIPGYSRIVQDVGVVNLSSIPPKVLENARERGHKIHTALQYLDEDRLDWGSVDPAFYGYIQAWISFCEKEGFRPNLDTIEMPTYHKAYRYGITPDRDGIFNRVDAPYPGIVEIKNTYSPAWYWCMQTAAQEHARRSHDWLDSADTPVLRCAVKLNKDGTYLPIWHRDPNDFKYFISCLVTYGLKRRTK